MEWLIIVPIFLAALLPIFWLMPNRRQRHETKRRLYAMQLGFRVSLQKVPLVDPEPQDLVDGAGRLRDAGKLMARYALSIRRPDHDKAATWHISRAYDVRQAQYAQPKLPREFHWRLRPADGVDAVLLARITAALEALAAGLEGIVALEQKGHEVAVFWDEAGDQAGIDRIQAALQPFL